MQLLITIVFLVPHTQNNQIIALFYCQCCLTIDVILSTMKLIDSKCLMEVKKNFTYDKTFLEPFVKFNPNEK